MSKKKVYLIVAFIFVLAFFLANLVYSQYWNQTADWLNAKKNEIKYIERLSNIPQFPEVPFKLGLDLQGGTHLVYEADLSNIEKADYSSSMQGLKDVIERRVNLCRRRCNSKGTNGKSDYRKPNFEASFS